MNKKTKTDPLPKVKKSTKNMVSEWIKNPKSRKVIYGVTDRTNDPFLLRVNDFMIDYGRVSAKEKSIFYNSLKLLVNSGVGFTQALRMLGDRTRNIRLSRVCSTIVYDMDHNGKSFSEAMAKYPKVFGKSEVKMIYSGELTGKIEGTLNAIATQLQKSINLELQVRNALMYPFTVFIAIIVAAIIVMLFIVPKFKTLFDQFGSDLPWITKMLMGSSSFFQHYWWAILTLTVGGVLMFRSWKSSPEGKKAWDQQILSMPIIKDLVNNIQTVRIASNFSTLMASGVPLAKALRVLGEIMKNSIIANAIFNIEMKVRKGIPLHEAFAAEPAIDSVIPEILEIGEKTGSIDNVLTKLETQYEMEVDAQLKNLTTLIEPLIIVVVGIAVVIMAMAIMLPIFQLQELFSNQA